MSVALSRPTGSRLANQGAELIEAAFDQYLVEFARLTRKAQGRFERREWFGALKDTSSRLELHRAQIDELVHQIIAALGDRIEDRLVWAGLKAVYSGRISGRPDWELAETFFNSVTRRVFSTVGVDADIEFVDSDFAAPPPAAVQQVHRSYLVSSDLTEVVRQILLDCGFDVPFANQAADARAVATRLMASVGEPDRIEILKAVFFRRKGAYVIGRLYGAGGVSPLVLSLINNEGGITVDAVLTDEDDVSILFSFTRSHFQVDLTPVHSVVAFLRTLMPRKRAAELYIATGHHKHGKTELYRDLLHHLQHSVEQFEPAPGVAGMVMVVFTLPGYDVVFKVLRDRFPPQKRLTRLEVRERYRLVFRHDRAGRLVEAQEFEHLELDQARFQAALLEEVLHEAGRTVHLVGNRVVVDHVYVERRVTPLDVYLRVSNPEAARAAVLDYGQAIKDLASTDIFPGDVLLKNFGVTRHGRVVFYDYDELELMSAVRFRDLPPPSSLDEEMAAAPWFGVGTNDVFPEEFASFLGLSGELRKVFDTHHWQLFDTSFWRQMQSRLTAGDLVDILPYPARRRLRAGGPGNRIQGSEK